MATTTVAPAISGGQHLTKPNTERLAVAQFSPNTREWGHPRLVCRPGDMALGKSCFIEVATPRFLATGRKKARTWRFQDGLSLTPQIPPRGFRRAKTISPPCSL
ncbi:hypothetical protein IG631_06240 [Alternaria alternata]|nr:hypothetical protein IG631_06240 [Alternaria alternata]